MIEEFKPSKMINKYPFSMKAPKFTLLLPKDFKFLSVAFQGDTPNIWIETVEATVREEFNFQLFGTGQEIPLTAIWLTTFSFGPFVFHLYKT